MSTPTKPDPKKYCQACGARLYRKRMNGRLEDMGVFQRRKYCDQVCMAQGMIKDRVSKAAYHERARRHRKDACEDCGSVEKLHVHHKDGDYRNDDPSNYVTLCASCHLRHHWQTASHRKGQRRSVLREPFEELVSACEDASLMLQGTPTGQRLQTALIDLRNSIDQRAIPMHAD